MTETTISERIAAITAAIGRVQTDEQHSHFRYKYASKDAIFAALKPYLADHPLAIVPEIEDIDTDPVSVGKGTEVRCVARKTITVSANGESRVYSWIGIAHDAGPQLISKAVANGVKTWLINTFLIPVGEEAPAPAPAPAQRPQPRNGNRRPPDTPETEKMITETRELRKALEHLGNVPTEMEPTKHDSEITLSGLRQNTRVQLMRRMMAIKYPEVPEENQRSHSGWLNLAQMTNTTMAAVAMGMEQIPLPGLEPKPEQKG